mmetsp:Transcript_12429/g.35558  ORF Transcript_12429/g.35558 Transcript_12429/m.35558 type:complete len:258 (-) Transcript_12429:192-965(-)
MFAMCLTTRCYGDVCQSGSIGGRLSTDEALRAMQGLRSPKGHAGPVGDLVFFHDPAIKTRDEVTIVDRPTPSPSAVETSPIGADWHEASDAGSTVGGCQTSPTTTEAYTSCAETSASSDIGKEHLSSETGSGEGPEEEAEAPLTSRIDRATRVQKLRCFLATHGFRGVNEPKKTGVAVVSRSFTYPLHAAVRANDLEAVHALLWAGGDRTKVDSQQNTPLTLALKLDRNGSHNEAIHVLSSYAKTPRRHRSAERARR